MRPSDHGNEVAGEREMCMVADSVTTVQLSVLEELFS
jgi:hypothetical protein